MAKNEPSTLPNVVSKKREFELIRVENENVRSSFLSPWRSLGDNFVPYRARFTLADKNKGTRKTQSIIDNTPTDAVRTLRAGMMSGITSPARPWLRMTTPDPSMADMGDVKVWLDKVTELMTSVFLKSNIYHVLPNIYGDAGVFATGAIIIEEDFEDVIRGYSVPVGTFSISSDKRGRINTFTREYRLSVHQMIEEFGRDFPGDEIHWDRFSDSVKTNYERGFLEENYDIIHTIKPNNNWKPDSPLAKDKKFESVHYQKTTSTGSGSRQDSTSINLNDGVFLRQSGFELFPVLVLRWEKTGDDDWGTDCPGIMSIDDNRSLQHMHRMKGQALDQKVKPTMTGPSSLRGSNPSVIPGKIVYTDERTDQKGFRRAFDINFQIDELKEEIRDTQDRIKKAFYVNLFLMLENLDVKDVTATAINELKEEKLLALGPVLESVNEDLLDPLIDITYFMMERQGLIPPAPEILNGVDLKVEYISIMAQAQKAVGLGSLRAFTDFALSIAERTQNPSILNRVNFDGILKQAGEGYGINSEGLNSDEQVAAMAAAEAQAAQQQQQQEQLLNTSQAAKNLGDASIQGDTALSAVIEGIGNSGVEL